MGDIELLGITRTALRSARTIVLSASIGALVLAVFAPHAAAHAKFFAEAGAPASSLPPLVIATAITLGLLVALTVRCLADTIHDPRRARCLTRWVCERIRVLEPAAPFVPVVARVALGVTLLLAASQGDLLAPHWQLAGDVAGPVLLAECLLGLMLTFGVAPRASAACVPVLLGGAAATFDAVAVLERLDIIGLSLFVMIAGGRRFEPRLREWELQTVHRAAWALRACVATGLLTTALTEKLLQPGITQQVLDQYPLVDASTVLPISQLTFIAVMATVEIVFAGLVMLLPIPEITALVVAGPFIMTVAVFGPAEVVGHLPVWGAMVSLLLLATHAQAHRVVNSLSPTQPAAPSPSLAPVVGARFVWSTPVAAPTLTSAPVTASAHPPLLARQARDASKVVPSAARAALPPVPQLAASREFRAHAGPQFDLLPLARTGS